MSDTGPTTTIVSTGEELVRGRSLDTNAAFIAVELERRGFDVRRIVTVGDNPGLLRSELERLSGEDQLIVMTGGLGPTADDRNRGAIAAAAGAILVEDAESREHVEGRIRGFGHEPTASHLTQALFPEGARIFPNAVGTACGFGCRVGECWVVAMPGVPSEMTRMFTESVLPFVMAELSPGLHVAVETIHIFPAPESQVDEMIRDMTEWGRNPSLGITVKDGVITVSVRGRGADEDAARALVAADVAELRSRFGERVFGTGDASLAGALRGLLAEAGLTVGVAESVTGGLIADMLVDVPGISDVFRGGAVAYSDDCKAACLGVSPALIDAHGAVSPEVAEAMAVGVCRMVGSDVGISTTGIAGPTGARPGKPVGLVYVGVCVAGDVRVRRLDLRGDRRTVRDRAAKLALNEARLALMERLDLRA